MSIERVYQDRYLQDEVIKVSIFLSLFSVHINRAPLTGKVELVQAVAGEYLPAYNKEASHKNVRNYLGLSTAWGKILVVQITGIIARRIVCWSKPGDLLDTGDRFGLIRFGSCTELYLPLEASILVKPGQKVKGAETVIAKFSK
jgi:phosphatidylserine decarboxylase